MAHVMSLPGMEASPMATVLPLTPRTEIVSGNAGIVNPEWTGILGVVQLGW